MRISIITCFYNSSRTIKDYSRALKQLSVGSVWCEYIFVDNASTDNTRESLDHLRLELGPLCRIVEERRPGLMYARCKGVEEAQGDWCLFLDDDNEPAINYLMEVERLIGKFPEAVGFTGNCLLPSGYNVDVDLVRALPLLAIRSARGEMCIALDSLCPQPMPVGAGLVVRATGVRDACRHWQASERLIVGRTGALPIGGEEVWMMHHVTRNGGVYVFSESLKLIHRVDTRRFEVRYLTKLAFEYGAVSPILVKSVRRFKPGLESRCGGGLMNLAYGVGSFLWALCRYCISGRRDAAVVCAARVGLIFGSVCVRAGAVE